MDIATILGFIVAFGALALSVQLEGGSLRSLVNVSAALIVFGGSLGAAMVSLPLACTLKIPIVLKHALFTRTMSPVASIELLARLARVARRDGVLALEGEVATIDDPFMRRGIQLVIDGTDPEVAEGIMETEIDVLAERHELAGKFFSTMGGLAPTLGVTGTVMGLVHMLGQLSEPGAMGPAIAAAFIATLYGVASANIVFIPIAAKLKVRSEEEQFVRNIIALGIHGLQAGDSPIVLTERLKAFLPPKARAAADQGAKGAESEGAGEPVGVET